MHGCWHLCCRRRTSVSEWGQVLSATSTKGRGHRCISVSQVDHQTTMILFSPLLANNFFSWWLVQAKITDSQQRHACLHWVDSYKKQPLLFFSSIEQRWEEKLYVGSKLTPYRTSEWEALGIQTALSANKVREDGMSIVHYLPWQHGLVANAVRTR